MFGQCARQYKFKDRRVTFFPYPIEVLLSQGVFTLCAPVKTKVSVSLGFLRSIANMADEFTGGVLADDEIEHR